MMKSILRNAGVRGVLHGVLRLRNRHFVLIDVLSLLVAPSAALFLRTEDWGARSEWFHCLVAYTLLSTAVRVPVFWRYDLYRRYWRYASIDDLLHIVLAAMVSTAIDWMLYSACVGLGVWDRPLPRSVPVISALLVLVAVGTSRLSVRLAQRLVRQAPRGDAKRVLIVGAGRHGQFVARELLTNPDIGMSPVGFLDDDAAKQGTRILNLTVLAGRHRVADCIAAEGVDEVIIAMPGTPGSVIRECVLQCEKAGVPAKILPGVSAILGGRFRIDQLRRVEIEDLLRREPIQTDTAAVHGRLERKRILVTGGGGSIGSELCRQILAYEPEEIILLGHGENSIFEIEAELRGMVADSAPHARRPCVTPVIADIRSAVRVASVVAQCKPHIVFHAAAHKHVPLMEANPTEAVANNVLGTRNLLAAAEQAGVEQLVMISTDKAVNPTSVMGASKRAAELLVLATAQRTRKPYVAVRFGNVLGSRGSVVPVFKRQIAAGGPVTVSHPEMRRFFMTIPEAVQLVLQASVLGRGGEIFILDMGEPVRIVDLARDLIELSGLRPGRDIEIVFTGVRPGEKLFEELYVAGESYTRTCHDKVLIAQNASAFVPGNLADGLRAAERAVEFDDPSAAVACLKRLVPEYARAGEEESSAGERAAADAESPSGYAIGKAVVAGRLGIPGAAHVGGTGA